MTHTTRSRRGAIALALWIALFGTLATPADAQWHTAVGGNDHRSGFVDVVGPTTPELAWSGSLFAFDGEPAAVDDGLVVLTRAVGIVAHELDTGAIRWMRELPIDPGGTYRTRVTGFRDGQVYATRSGNFTAEYLYALDPADGSILWQSEARIRESSVESVAFAPNGDLVTNGVDDRSDDVLVRIRHTDGTTAWSTPRGCPTDTSCGAVVFGDRAYITDIAPGFAGFVVTAVDLATGAKLHSTLPADDVAGIQLAPFVGPDGTLYVPHNTNTPSDYLVALVDTGASFVEAWRVPIGFTPFGSHGVGTDGSVYAYARDGHVMRLDPTDGSVLDTSPAPVVLGFGDSPRMALDGAGNVFVTSGASLAANGRLWAFTPDLEPLWDAFLPHVDLGGPALGADGTLIVSAGGTDVRAYRGARTGCVVLDFETEDDLATPLVDGQDVSTPLAFGTLVAIGATGEANFGPAIFDSAPFGPNAGGADPDLLVDLGNVLILQENQLQSAPGIFDFPDDAQLGGTLLFDFVTPVELRSVDLIDICPGPPVQDATLTLIDEQFRSRTYSVPGGWTGDLLADGPPGYGTLDLTTLAPQPGDSATATAVEDPDFRPGRIVRLEVFFSSSGALDNLEVCTDAPRHRRSGASMLAALPARRPR